MKIRAGGRLLAAGCALVLALAAGRVSAAPPVADFFRPAEYANLSLSPSGRLLAATVPAAHGRRALVVIDIEDAGKSRIVAAYDDADVDEVHWVNDERLLYRLYDKTAAGWWQQVLVSIDAAGKQGPVRLPSQYVLHSVLRDGSNDVLLLQTFRRVTGEPSHVNLFRMDTSSGQVRSQSHGAPEHVASWTVDRQGRPRAVLTDHGGVEALHWRPKVDGPWVRIAEAPSTGAPLPKPLLAESERRVWVVAHLDPRPDRASLGLMDLTDPARPKTDALMSIQGFDFAGAPVLGR